MKKYDYLIVGAGLYGAVFAHEVTKQGKTCLVIDKRNHFGGNVYCENIEGINVHKYGAHIFHTNDKGIWDYVNQFVEFNRYTNSPIALYKDKLYNLPFNMNTFNQLWGVKTPEEAKAKITEQVLASGIVNPKNLEEQAISLVGIDIYEKLIKGYTEKQWGRKAADLPAFIIKRLPVRFTYDNNYFNDKYQGIPIGGYNILIEGLLNGVKVRLNEDFFKNREMYSKLATTIVFTGKIDEYYNNQFGTLEYRSLKFDTKVVESENFQGNAVVNYTEADVPYTRIIEHKHFEFGSQKNTVVTYEYPDEWTLGKESYYPVNDDKNNTMYNKYKKIADEDQSVIFGGRLAEYKYYDMHQIIASALNKVKILKTSK
jgi:UDP-galactopyranose mutase